MFDLGVKCALVAVACLVVGEPSHPCSDYRKKPLASRVTSGFSTADFTTVSP